MFSDDCTKPYDDNGPDSGNGNSLIYWNLSHYSLCSVSRVICFVLLVLS